MVGVLCSLGVLCSHPFNQVGAKEVDVRETRLLALNNEQGCLTGSNGRSRPPALANLIKGVRAKNPKGAKDPNRLLLSHTSPYPPYYVRHPSYCRISHTRGCPLLRPKPRHKYQIWPLNQDLQWAKCNMILVVKKGLFDHAVPFYHHPPSPPIFSFAIANVLYCRLRIRQK